jgi:hypothetical protein
MNRTRRAAAKKTTKKEKTATRIKRAAAVALTASKADRRRRRAKARALFSALGAVLQTEPGDPTARVAARKCDALIAKLTPDEADFAWLVLTNMSYFLP